VFRTELNIPSSPVRIDHQSCLFTIGSCFSDVIGEKLLKNKFQVLANPFGVVYNPESIFKLLNAALRVDEFEEDSYIEKDKIWRNYHLHSEVFGKDLPDLKHKIHSEKLRAHEFLLKTKVLAITFGSAFAYRLKSNQQIVSNCHKMPPGLFNKELLSPVKIIHDFDSFYQKVQEINPDLKIILTISPVRHIKDTIQLNNVSKSVLRLASHWITEQHENISYFPAFEMMMDDLRDYRFYKEDMIHPTEVAENYIWEKFIGTYMENKSKEFIKEWTGVLKALEHKPFHPDSESHQAFIRETIKKIKSLSGQADLSLELRQLESLLK
jgi:hypothetical protein